MTNNDTIEIKKSTLTNGTIGVLALLLVISMFTGGFGIGSDATNGNAVVVPSAPSVPTEAPRQAPVKVNMDDITDTDAVKGDKDAQVTIVEFSDYECPFCARFYDQTYGQIKEEYIDTGKVKLIFRDYPLDFHQNAQKAAEAAECAGDQDKYYEMHDMLFADGVDGGVDSYKVYADTIGLDTDEFNKCLDSGKFEDEVKKDFVDGQKAGVTGTPAFFIDGELVVGAQPFSVFKEKIDAALA